MKDFKRSSNKPTTFRMTSNKLSKKSRNVTRFQEKQLKRGRFTKYP